MNNAPDSLLVVPTAEGGTLLQVFAQAGGFQWPILAILLVGLMALALAAVRLTLDGRSARALRALGVDASEAGALQEALGGSPRCLYHRLLKCMLRVWRRAPASLSQESQVVLEAARAEYGRTQRLVGFLSSAAGGLGLLGTLVGIYTLFSAEMRDTQTIFGGIALAIVSTLLGIMVSITLELTDALLQSWASRYIARAEVWAAAVRHRLLDLLEA